MQSRACSVPWVPAGKRLPTGTPGQVDYAALLALTVAAPAMGMGRHGCPLERPSYSLAQWFSNGVPRSHRGPQSYFRSLPSPRLNPQFHRKNFFKEKREGGARWR